MPMRPSAQSEFNYASLELETSRFVQQQTGQIKLLMKRTAQGIVEIGQKLIEVKEKLGYGNFGDWLLAEFDWSSDTAGRFINVATRFSNFPQIAEFAPSALYLLAAPSIPEAARAEATARARSGEYITYTTAEEIKRKYISPLQKIKQKPSLPKAEPPADEAVRSSEETQIITTPAQAEPDREPREINPLKLEILALHSKVKESATVKETEASAKLSRHGSLSVQLGSWWQLGRHWLYCGEPQSTSFQERLPNQVALSLTFPQSHRDWPISLASKIKSAVCLFTTYQDQDLALLRELVKNALLLYSESDDTVVFSFLPEPELLFLAHQLDCQCYVAEPNKIKCEMMLSRWEKTGRKIKKMYDAV